MKRCCSVLAVVLVLTLFAVSAQAQRSTRPARTDRLVTSNDGNVLLEFARTLGDATLGKDSFGDPEIKGDVNGTDYRIYFDGCTSGRDCSDMIFVVHWEDDYVTMDDVNEWNAGRYHGKAYLDSDGDPAMELVVNLAHGVSRANMESTFELWERTVSRFESSVLDW